MRAEEILNAVDDFWLGRAIPTHDDQRIKDLLDNEAELLRRILIPPLHEPVHVVPQE